MLKAVLFDLDGTLINSEEYYVNGTYKWILENNIRVNIADIYPIIGLTMKDTYDYLSKLTGLSIDKCKKINENYFYNENPLDFKKSLFPEVETVFKRIKESGLKIAICSMSPLNYIEKFGVDTNLKKYIDYYVSGENLKNTKPDPEIYLKALVDLNLSNSEAVAVEDATSGIKSAKGAGLKVIARDAKRFKIDQSLADFVIKDLNELQDVIL